MVGISLVLGWSVLGIELVGIITDFMIIFRDELTLC
jgi:hypothetical protein